MKTIRILVVISTLVGMGLVSARDSLAQVQVIAPVSFRGRTWVVTLERCGPQTRAVWLRQRAGACSPGDVLVMGCNSFVNNIQNVRNQICRWKGYVDWGYLVAGCTATVGTGICAVTGDGSGFGVALCASAMLYTYDAGATTCVMGVAGMVAQALGRDREFTMAMYGINVQSGNLTTAYQDMLWDALCRR